MQREDNDSLQDIVKQEWIEYRYNRKHIDPKIRTVIEENLMDKVQQGCDLVANYMAGQYYESKMHRIAQLKSLDIPELVLEIFIGVAYCLRAELFTSVSAQIAARLKFSDRAEAITTVAELLGVLCRTDAFDIFKETKQSSLMLVSRMQLPQELMHFIEDSAYLPPMVCQPRELVSNYSSGYLTHNDSLILGTGNHHDGDLCLDVLNIMNSVPLQMDLQFLSTVEEQPTFELDTQDKTDQWAAFKLQSYRFYSLMQQNGNRFYMTHKVDKRGRIYSQGYHINPQGAAFKKAMLELADEELVEGVPT